ncbi:MAG: hypothetical protein JXB00_08725 [Bacteroidales bacterium]|nr:hypothetical protein [Bacteroidales bacterium]
MEQILLFIKHRLGILWAFIEMSNNTFFYLLFSKKLEQVLYNLFRESFTTPYHYRKLTSDDLEALNIMIESQDPADLKYFHPHNFDITSLKKQFAKRSFLMMGAFDQEKIIGYFFLRFFVTRKAFVGRIIDKTYRGSGVGNDMNRILYETTWRMGFRCLSTVSLSNTAVIRAHAKNPSMKVIKNLNRNYQLIEFVKNK